MAESYALDDNEAPMSMECDICGTKDFYLESGFYYCSLCNTQSQQTREYVDEQDFAPERQFSVRRTGMLKKSARISVKYKEQPIFLSSWEVHNLIIKAMTDKLIALGFPHTLKAKVFQIWSFYLSKRRAIFKNINKDQPLLVSLQEPKMNLYSLHDYKQKRRITPKKVKSATAKKPFEDEETEALSHTKRKKSMSKRKAMESEYRVEAAKQSKDNDVYDDIINESTVEAALTIEKHENPPISFTKQSKKTRTALKQKKTLLKLSSEYDKVAKPSGLGRGLEILKVERFTLKNTIILLFVALRQVGCPVVFSDLMRMLRDGTLYVQSLKLLMQEDDLNAVSGISASFLTSIYRFDNAIRCADEIEDFIQYVGLKQFRYPKFEELLPKFIDDLGLPKEFECLVIQMNKLFKMEEFMEDLRGPGRQWKTMAEVWVLATIGVAMKIMFGLDDVTEKYQSQFAQTVNKIILKKASDPSDLNYKLLFVLHEWFKYTEIKDTIVKKELFSGQMYNPEQDLNLTAVNNLIDRYGGNKVLSTGVVSRSKDKALEMLSRITLGTEEMDHMVTVSDYLTIPLPKQTVMSDYQKLMPNVCYPEFKETGYQDTFLDRRIDYITHPERYFYLLEDEGYKVKVVYGPAKADGRKLPKDPKILIAVKPYKRFDDYVGKPNECSNSLRYLINQLNDIAIGADKFGGNKPLFHMLFTTVGDLLCRKCIAGFVPMDNYENINKSQRERNLANAQKRFAWLKHLKRKVVAQDMDENPVSHR